MTYKGIIKKSKTMDFAAMLTVFGVLQEYLPALKSYIGEHFPIVTVLIAVIVALLRMVTTQPLSDK